jgi:hypothetical protein
MIPISHTSRVSQSVRQARQGRQAGRHVCKSASAHNSQIQSNRFSSKKFFQSFIAKARQTQDGQAQADRREGKRQTDKRDVERKKGREGTDIWHTELRVSCTHSPPPCRGCCCSEAHSLGVGLKQLLSPLPSSTPRFRNPRTGPPSLPTPHAHLLSTPRRISTLGSALSPRRRGWCRR